MGSCTVLVSGSTEDFARARFEDRELLEMFQEIEKFPADEKAAVKQVLDAFVTRRRLKEMAAK